MAAVEAAQAAATTAGVEAAAVATAAIGTATSEAEAAAEAAATAASNASASATSAANAAALVGAPADTAIAAAVNGNGATKTALNATIVDALPGNAVLANRATDLANSWWNEPRTYYDTIRQRIYFTGVARGSAAVVGTAMMYLAHFDLRTGEVVKHPVRVGVPDDHNAPAMLITADMPPLLFTTNHNGDNNVLMHKGPAAHDFTSFTTSTIAFGGANSYQHVVRKPGTQTIMVTTRQADGWYMRRSTDWGTTRDAAIRLHGKQYSTFGRNGNTIHYVTTVHPVDGVNIDVRYFKIDLETGAITNAAGTAIDNLWTMTGPVPAANMTLVRQYTDPNSTRVLDVAEDGSILVCDLDKTNPQAGGTYKVMGIQTADTWPRQDIVASGVPVGYYQKGYVGGATFGATGAEVFLTRESAGTWTLEKWTRTGTTWAHSETLRTVSGGTKLGRPQVPFLGEATKHLLCLEYAQYATDSYWDYYADELLLERP